MLNDYISQHKERFLEELLELLRIPSISADSNYVGDIRKMAEALADNLRNSGADNVEILPTGGHPAVFAEKIIDPNLPTVLVYGHMDVMPVDPLNLWKSDPFEPEIRDEKIYARGADDDKGQGKCQQYRALSRLGLDRCRQRRDIECAGNAVENRDTIQQQTGCQRTEDEVFHRRFGGGQRIPVECDHCVQRQ